MRFVTLAASILFFAFHTHTYGNKVSLTFFTEQFPPYNFQENGKSRGINADILKEVCQQSGMECDFVFQPWVRAMYSTKTTKNSGLFSTSKTPSREENFKWVGPLVSGIGCFYRLKSRSDISITSQSDLSKYTTGLQRRDIYQYVLDDWQLKEGVNYLTYETKNQDVKMFKAKKLDLIIASSVTLATKLKKVGLSPTDVVPVFELKHKSLKGNYLALNKQIDDVIVEQLQNTLNALKANNHINAIIDNYLVSYRNQKTSLPPQLNQCLVKETIY